MNHAVLAPSAAHRWLNCPPSARLEETFPDTQSDAAAEGTFAHMLAEIILQDFLYKRETDLTAFEQNQFYSTGLVDYVSIYTSVVIEKYLNGKNIDANTELLLEQRFDLSDFVPESFGHADAVILSDKVLEIVDLKYGAGVPIKAKNNPQLRLYAIGVYSGLSFLYDIQTVKVTIVQPRNGGVSSETLSIDDLLDWGEQIKPIAQAAFLGKGEFKAGEHCKFCRVANRCKVLADYMLDKVKVDFDNADLLSDSEIADLLLVADDIIKWLNNVKAYALKESLDKGKQWKGFKLVEGRSVRKIINCAKVAEILKEYGGTEDQIWKPKELLGITALEKNFGKKKLNELLGDLMQKPAGAPTLVIESDPRPAWHKAESDFKILV